MAQRLSFLVDGEAYFGALHSALQQARRSIFIAGWDIHSQLRLVRGGEPSGLPSRLGPLLEQLVLRRRELQVFILIWDFAAIYLLEREILPALRLGWATPRRMHFRLDGNHPLGASHHQKLVVLDDEVAFLGGLDLTEYRWDTRAHAAGDPRRITWQDKPYEPFHDVQVAVQGPIARAAGELFRERWQRATGKRLSLAPPAAGPEPAAGPVPAAGPEPAAGPADPWPTELEPQLRQVQVGLARTEPAWEGRDAVREVEQLYLDAIAAAQHTIYIENQYLTSAAVGQALASSLEQEQGPDVVVVTPERCAGWMERASMGVLRGRLLERLRQADRHHRLRVLYPSVDGTSVNVHAKVLVVDQRLARVGSANLSNRSMGLDSECDLALEATDDPGCAAVSQLRDDLLAEHLGLERSQVAQAVQEHGSLAQAVDRLRGEPGQGQRTLHPLEPEVPEWLDDVVPEPDLVDPERPLDYEDMAGALLPEELQPTTRDPVMARLALWAGLCAALVLWRVSPAGAALGRR